MEPASANLKLSKQQSPALEGRLRSGGCCGELTHICSYHMFTG